MTRNRLRDCSDQWLWHSLIEWWGEAMTSENDQGAVKAFLMCEKYLREINRRGILAGQGCVCEECCERFTDPADLSPQGRLL